MKNMKFCKMSFFLSKRIIKVNNEDEEKKKAILSIIVASTCQQKGYGLINGSKKGSILAYIKIYDKNFICKWKSIFVVTFV